MAEVRAFRPKDKRDFPLSLDLSNHNMNSNTSSNMKLNTEAFPDQPWLRLENARPSGPETPPSDVSTPTLLQLEDDSLSLASSPSSAVTPPAVPELLRAARIANSSRYQTILPSDQPVVAVLGVGYVGTHLVDTFSTKHSVIGFDVSPNRIKTLLQQQAEQRKIQLASLMNQPQQQQLDESEAVEPVHYTSDAGDLRQATHFLISVPTLLRQDGTVDASYLCKALQLLEEHARTGATIVIESSVAVGMTRELLGPLAMQRGFLAGMSPERVDPGRTDPPVSSIPKIISALEDLRPGSLDSITRLYSTVFSTIVPVSSPEVAEMTKLYENCQRMMCIAYANEMADACGPHNIDPYEVCRAAATKPFGYMSYLPGLGVGGHCIPVNPYYLLSNSNFPLLKMATQRMDERPERIGLGIAEKLREKFTDRCGVQTRKPRVLVVGMGFKKGQSTLSNSPGLKLLKTLHFTSEMDLTWADSMVAQKDINSVPRLPDHDWTPERLSAFDLVLVTFLQPNMDIQVLDHLPQETEVSWLGMRPN